MAETGMGSTQSGADARRAASDAVRHATEQARDLGNKATGQIKEQLRSGAEEQKAQVGGTLHTLASKLNETSGQVDSQWVGSLVSQAATSLHQAANYFESSRPETFLNDFSTFARRNPAIVMGAAVAVGFLLARAGRVAAGDMSEGQSSGTGGNGAMNDGYSTGYAPPADAGVSGYAAGTSPVGATANEIDAPVTGASTTMEGTDVGR